MASRGTMKKVTVERMKEYLWHAMQFETYVYIWSKAMDAANNEMQGVYDERKRLQNKKVAAAGARQDIADKYAKKSEKEQLRLDQQIKALENRIEICKKRRPKFLMLSVIFGILAVLAAVIGASADVVYIGAIPLLPCAIFVIRYSIDNKRIKSAQKRIPELRNKTARDYSEQQTKEVANVNLSVSDVDYDLAKLDRQEEALNAHQERIFLELQNAKKVLSNIYDLDFIHKDYRDFVAVSTMYGYLDRGRCTILEGFGGIYDTFEKDLQMNQVIRNLQDLNASMSRVEANQRVLIDQMRTANSHLEGMNKSLRSIEFSSQQTAQNTAAIAVSSKQAAAELQWQSYQMWARS